MLDNSLLAFIHFNNILLLFWWLSLWLIIWSGGFGSGCSLGLLGHIDHLILVILVKCNFEVHL